MEESALAKSGVSNDDDEWSDINTDDDEGEVGTHRLHIDLGADDIPTPKLSATSTKSSESRPETTPPVSQTSIRKDSASLTDSRHPDSSPSKGPSTTLCDRRRNPE